MFQGKVLVLKLVTIDRLATGTVMVGEVTSLAHKSRNHSVEAAALVSESLLTSAKTTEIFRSLRNNIRSELKFKNRKKKRINDSLPCIIYLATTMLQWEMRRLRNP